MRVSLNCPLGSEILSNGKVVKDNNQFDVCLCKLIYIEQSRLAKPQLHSLKQTFVREKLIFRTADRSGRRSGCGCAPNTLHSNN